MEITLKASLPNFTLDCKPVKLDPPKYSIGDRLYWKEEKTHPDYWREVYVAGICLNVNQWRHRPTILKEQPSWEYEVGDRLSFYDSTAPENQLVTVAEWEAEYDKYSDEDDAA